MTDAAEHNAGQTADEGRPERVTEGERLLRRRNRRISAYRSAEHTLARLGPLAPLRERLALLDGADALYDLDEASDLYGNGIVEALEEKVAGLLGKEAAAFFPTGTMAQQVALRCWAGRTGNPTVALHGRVLWGSPRPKAGECRPEGALAGPEVPGLSAGAARGHAGRRDGANVACRGTSRTGPYLRPARPRAPGPSHRPGPPPAPGP